MNPRRAAAHVPQNDNWRCEAGVEQFGPRLPELSEGQPVVHHAAQLSPRHRLSQRIEIGLLLNRRTNPLKPFAEIGDVLIRTPGRLDIIAMRPFGNRPKRLRVEIGRGQPAPIPCAGQKGVRAVGQLPARERMVAQRLRHQNWSAASRSFVSFAGAVARQLRWSHSPT